MAVKETHSTCPSRKLHSLAFSGTEQQKHQRSSGTELQDKCVCLLSAQKVRAELNGLFVPLVFVVLFLPLSPPSFTHSQELADCLELNSGISFFLIPPYFTPSVPPVIPQRFWALYLDNCRWKAWLPSQSFSHYWKENSLFSFQKYIQLLVQPLTF